MGFISNRTKPPIMVPQNSDNKTATKLIRILNALEEYGEMGVTELATHLDIAKSTVYYHLSTLTEEGLVVQIDGKYRLGLRFLEIGEHIRNQIQPYNVAKEEIDKVAEKTGELGILMVEEKGLGIYLYKAPGERAVDLDAPIGRAAPLHNRALGKAILAYLDHSRVEEIISEHGLPKTTGQTITTSDRLFDELKQVQEEGIAYNKEESIEGLHGVAVPILDTDDDVLGAISIAGPSTRLDGEILTEKYPDLLLRTRNLIELKIREQNNH